MKTSQDICSLLSNIWICAPVSGYISLSGKTQPVLRWYKPTLGSDSSLKGDCHNQRCLWQTRQPDGGGHSWKSGVSLESRALAQIITIPKEGWSSFFVSAWQMKGTGELVGGIRALERNKTYSADTGMRHILGYERSFSGGWMMRWWEAEKARRFFVCFFTQGPSRGNKSKQTQRLVLLSSQAARCTCCSKIM